MSALVEFDMVSKNLGGCPVLREIDFAIASGGHLALLGPSGCGKTTLLHLLAGLDAPTGGRVSIQGRTVSETGRVIVPPHRRGIGMVFQDLALWPGLSALENVAAGMPPGGATRKARRAEAEKMLGLCGLTGLERRKPAQLSAGQQQRVALARALAVEPLLLLLDEPFTGLDLTVKEDLVCEITEMAGRFGATVVLVSHDPWEVTTLCSRAVVIEDGVVAEQGELAQLLKAPSSGTLRAVARHAGW